jgi:hypothetical protein
MSIKTTKPEKQEALGRSALSSKQKKKKFSQLRMPKIKPNAITTLVKRFFTSM